MTIQRNIGIAATALLFLASPTRPLSVADPLRLASAAQQHPALSDSAFARLITRVAEPAGYFDSDNLISNETGYLYPVPKMLSMGISGGAVVGVGPDQNYSYIAAVRPAIAFMIDIRRDAGLQHLLYKELMAQARNRMEYLCLLLGKPVPADVERWSTRSLSEILDAVEQIAPRAATFDSTVARVKRRLSAMPHRITADELASIARMHTEFFHAGLGLRFTTLGRPPSRNYPTFRSLLVETDIAGNQMSYASSEERFQIVKSLHARNLIIPVTGDLSGTKALREIGRYLREKGLVVSAFYVSNVEYYLMRAQNFAGYAENVATLPRNERTVIIRSVFDNPGGRYLSVDRQAGAFSEQLMTTMDSFVRTYQGGGYPTYYDLVTKNRIVLRR